MKISATVPIPAPAPTAWAALTDWPHQSDWMLATRTHVISGDGRSVGSRLLGFTGVWDIGFVDELEIIEWTPPRVCRARHLGTLLRGTASFTIDPQGTGSVITWTEHLDPPLGPLGHIALRALSPLLSRAMTHSLRRLAARPW